MPKVEENKKILTKIHPRTPCGIKYSSIPKRGMHNYLVSISKTDLLVGAAKTEEKPSLRFASNGIHTKSGADNLQGNSFRKGPGASQVSIQRGNQNPVSQTFLNTSKR